MSLKTKKYILTLKKIGYSKAKNSKSLSFFYNGDIFRNIVNIKLINLIKKIYLSEKINLRINLHSNPKVKYHDMILLQQRGTEIKIHKHFLGGETIHLMYGRLKIFIFNEKGNIIKSTILDKNNLIFRIPDNYYHSIRILSKYSIYHENKSGPFNSASNIYLN